MGPSSLIRPSTETEIVSACLGYLRAHPKVAWAERMNSGRFAVKGARWVTFGFKGLSDIIGQLKSGVFLAVEVKRPGEAPTEDQQKFLDIVERNGGLAIVAESVDAVRDGLAWYCRDG